MQNEKFRFYLLVLMAAIIIFSNLGSVPLLDPDEPVYGQTPKEMIATGDYVSPRIYGQYWYDKPPLFYWLVAASYKLFGVSEFAARFPSALLAVLGILSVYLFARKLFREKVAFSAALILLTSLEYVYLSKAAVTDMTLCFFLTASLFSFLLKRYYLFYLFAALAVLTKGPIGILFPFGIVLLYLFLTKQLAIVRQMKLFSGLFLFCLVALPWYFFMYGLHGNIFVETFLGFHNLTRFTTPEHTGSKMWYFFLPVLLAGFFPWSAVLVQAVRASLRTADSAERNCLIFCNIWAGFIFLFFTLSQTKLVSYILPMWPPLAILVAWYINQLRHDVKKYCFSWGGALFLLVMIFLAGLGYSAQNFPELIVGITASAIILTVMLLFCLVLFWRRQINSVFWTQFWAAILFIAIALNTILPVLTPKLTSKDLALEFSENYDGHSTVNIIKFLRPGFAFYSGIYGQEIPEKNLAQTVSEDDAGYYIIKQKDYDKLSAELKKTMTLMQKTEEILILRKH